MTIIETKHTLSRFNKIKRDLLKTKTIISILSMLAFLGYYAYLITLNLKNILYISIYSSLILSILLFFIIEVSIKENKHLLRNDRRTTTERKRKLKDISKVLKFVAKTILVSIAMYETINNFNFMLPNIINIGSAILLVFQIIFEFILKYVIKEIDYFKLSLDLDLKESSILVKKIIGTFTKAQQTEDEIFEKLGISKYSPQEQKMIGEIKIEAKQYSDEKQDKLEQLKQYLESLEPSEKPKESKKLFKIK